MAFGCTRLVFFSVLMARFSTVMMPSLLRDLTTTTRLRERRGEITSKEGFSVVAPSKVMRPDSTWGRKASCWALLKRWISSTKRTVRRFRFQFWRAISTTFSTSFLPEVTAEISINSALNSRAIMRARVVLPVPGGPQKMMLTGSCFLTISVRILPSPMMSSWPTTSARDLGRMRSARGTLFMSILYHIYAICDLALFRKASSRAVKNLPW